MLSKEAFEGLCDEGFTHVPLVRDLPLDPQLTPPKIYQRIASAPYTYLLESAESNTQWGRYSFIGLPSCERIEVYGNKLSVMNGTTCQQEIQCADPLAWIDEYLSQVRVPSNLTPFSGGLVGYFGYECIAYIEPKLKQILSLNKQDDLKVPDILLLVSREVAVYDRKHNKISLIINTPTQEKGAYDNAQKRLDEIEGLLHKPEDSHATDAVTRTDERHFSSQFGKEKYCAAVEKMREYIAAGDVMQVVLSQRLSAPYHGHPFDCYRHLRKINPSPYMYYFDFDQFHVAGSSPEVLVRVEENKVTVRPIAGTRPRGKDEAENIRLEKELVQDEKELAEHLMLIDLGRNDLGRICQTGSVKVQSQMDLERYSHVVHLVSRVAGEVSPDASMMDVLRATFPAGTVSGAPKIRAMELIGESESVKRGIYSGAVGYASWGNSMDLAIAIRTLLIRDQVLYAQAGAGIVYDSKPLQEWEETMSKARVLMRAAELSSQAQS